MKCELCHQADAQEAIHKVVNGEDCELYVCSSCAHPEKIPLQPKQPAAKITKFITPEELPSELVSLVEKVVEATVEIVGKSKSNDTVTCPCCGMTRAECRKIARLGCMMCYGLFKEDVERAIKEMQRATHHHGKKPKNALTEEHLHALHDELKSALESRNEKAFADVAKRIEATGFFPPFKQTGVPHA